MIYPEIREWVQREVIFNPENTVDQEYADISKMFGKGNRSTLEHILGNDKAEFLEFLESELSRVRGKPETDEEIDTPEQGADDLEPRIRELSQGIADGLANLLGTPMRTIDSVVTPTIRVIEDIIVEPTSIIGKVSNFIRGLFK